MAKTQDLEDLRQVMLETARLQFATLNAGVTFWSAWADTASKTSQAINEQLLSIGKTGTKTDEILSTITDLSREFIRKTAELPNTAVARFNADVKVPASGGRTRRKRSARAKD